LREISKVLISKTMIFCIIRKLQSSLIVIGDNQKNWSQELSRKSKNALLMTPDNYLISQK